MKRPFDQMQGGATLIAATLLLGPCRCVVLPGPEMASNTCPWKIMRTQVCPSPVTFYSWMLILEFSSDADWLVTWTFCALALGTFCEGNILLSLYLVSSGPLPSVHSCPVFPPLTDTAPSTCDTLYYHPQLAHEALLAWIMGFSQVLNEHIDLLLWSLLNVSEILGLYPESQI